VRRALYRRMLCACRDGNLSEELTTRLVGIWRQLRPEDRYKLFMIDPSLRIGSASRQVLTVLTRYLHGEEIVPASALQLHRCTGRANASGASPATTAAVLCGCVRALSTSPLFRFFRKEAAASSRDLRPVHWGLTSCSPCAAEVYKRLMNFLRSHL
jgi:hypothetical protein